MDSVWESPFRQSRCFSASSLSQLLIRVYSPWYDKWWYGRGRSFVMQTLRHQRSGSGSESRGHIVCVADTDFSFHSKNWHLLNASRWEWYFSFCTVQVSWMPSLHHALYAMCHPTDEMFSIVEFELNGSSRIYCADTAAIPTPYSASLLPYRLVSSFIRPCICRWTLESFGKRVICLRVRVEDI